MISASRPGEPIAPHGGTLVDRRVDAGQEREWLAAAAARIPLSPPSLDDLECIATGVYSPLTGFLGEQDQARVVKEMRLVDGTVWPIPVTLPVGEDRASSLRAGDRVVLEFGGEPLAGLEVTDLYRPDPEEEAQQVYGTTDRAHPGVAALFDAAPVRAGGPVFLFRDVPRSDFPTYRRTPAETRAVFLERGWKQVVAFQTRNPVHRAHEYLLKVALELVDGLLLHPLVGATKSDDIPADVRMRTYEAVLDNYFPAERTLLSVFPAAMRYAGPREAILHALARKNYGCSHFIVGRDHAGVGNYYGTYEAQEIFDRFSPEEIGITPLKFEHCAYCSKTRQMVSLKTSRYGNEHWVFLSGSRVRDLLAAGKSLPPEFTRPEVAEILREAYQKMPEGSVK